MVTELLLPNELSVESIIEQALKQLKARASTYEKFHAYYIGEQPLTFASEKYGDSFSKMVAAYTENMCPAIVDAIADRLVVTGVESVNDTAAQSAWDIWRRNRMDEKAGQVHTEALKAGDSYVIVWPDVVEPGFIRLWPQDANGCTVHYEEETAHIDWAAKWWVQGADGRGRITLYFADRILRYITRSKVTQHSWPVKASGFEEFAPQQVNPFGKVPVFHFANNSRIGMWGRSELADILPLQDALNKSVCDMLVSMEFMAFPQRWATGIQVRNDPVTGKPDAPWKPGIDRIWSTGNAEARFGQFAAADLQQMLSVQGKFKQSMSDVSGIPSHYIQLAMGGQWPSGESLKTAETRFVSKIEDRQVSYGNVWEDILTLALQMLTRETEPMLDIDWREASPHSEMEMLQQALLRKQIGVPNQQLQKELGYTDNEVEKMAEIKEEETRAIVENQQRLFNAGNTSE